MGREHKEVIRIRQEERYVEITGNPSQIRADVLPRDIKILVCGAYRNLCVKAQLDALKKAGYDAVIYNKATIR